MFPLVSRYVKTWMLFSNLVVLVPLVQFESWAMESVLEPYVHFIPIQSDSSDLEKQIQWTEDNPDKTQMIAQWITLFIYDLLFQKMKIVSLKALWSAMRKILIFLGQNEISVLFNTSIVINILSIEVNDSIQKMST
eukprot:scaffold524_cov55-Attheya_sp.AAC.4